MSGEITVRRLIEILSEHDQDAIVVMSKDAEGNSFSPIDRGEYGVSDVWYVPESTYAGEIYDIEDPEDDDSDDCDDYDAPDLSGALRAVVMWPTN
jgi:hypothetical protein